jgi:hypothetical protein
LSFENAQIYEKEIAHYHTLYNQIKNLLIQALITKIMVQLDLLIKGDLNIEGLSSLEGERTIRKRNAQLYEFLKNNNVFKPFFSLIETISSLFNKEGTSIEMAINSIDNNQINQVIDKTILSIKALLEEDTRFISYTSNARKKEEIEFIIKAIEKFLREIGKKINNLKP